MTDAVSQLKTRLEEVYDLGNIAGLLGWDQRVLMPPAGAPARGRQMGLLQRLAHEQLIAPEVGKLLDELGDSLDPETDDGALVRVGRRLYEKSVQVPPELSAEMTRAAADGAGAWMEAKQKSDFSIFLPALERNVELRHRYVACFEPREEPYDILLDDFEPEMETAEVRRIFAEIKPEIVDLVASRREVDDSFLTGDFPVDRQEALSKEIVEMFGMRPGSWRVDPTEHPFAGGPSNDDIRMTTHYYPDSLESVFSTMHEYGHGLYEHQIPHRFASLPIGTGTSLAVHESQSRLWENLVGRSAPFWRFYYPRLQSVFPEQLGDVELDAFVAGVNKVQPSLIRIRADEVTYGLHVILRFELEQDIINGRVDLKDLPEVWNQKMWDYLGIEVPDDANGVLQDMHWSAGLIGYFSTYLLGTVMSVQIWEKASADLGDMDGKLERGEFDPLREWLGENLHALGGKFTPQETLRKVTGSTIDSGPYLAYLKSKYGAAVGA